MKKWALILIAVLAVAVLAGCGSDKADHKAVKGDALLNEAFDQSGTWEEGQYPADSPVSFLAITDGRYQISHRAENSSSFVWGVGGTESEDVIIEVETEQLSSDQDNLYGVGCRLSEDSGETTGYMLLISGDGHFGIARLSNRSLDFIQDWKQSGAIKQGQAKNTIRAVCVGDYLALYANGDFLGDVTDNTYHHSGHVGLVAGANRGKDITVTFDNLAVFDGALKD